MEIAVNQICDLTHDDVICGCSQSPDLWGMTWIQPSYEQGDLVSYAETLWSKGLNSSEYHVKYAG